MGRSSNMVKSVNRDRQANASGISTAFAKGMALQSLCTIVVVGPARSCSHWESSIASSEATSLVLKLE